VTLAATVVFVVFFFFKIGGWKNHTGGLRTLERRLPIGLSPLYFGETGNSVSFIDEIGEVNGAINGSFEGKLIGLIVGIFV
jgi:hypothetical protein